ncbi:hypothetical protein [Roseococcus sp.]|uniref:hypothetical protein n=1 Tax=Roseococcus sp. TaxID=2109646 RepID=UPI003BAD6278
MVKASVFLMVVLTVLVFIGMRWRERRMTAAKPAVRIGWLAGKRASFDRWVTAAAIAAVGTTLLLGGLHWLRVWRG